MGNGNKIEHNEGVAGRDKVTVYNSSSWIVGLIFFCSGIVAYGYFISDIKSSNIPLLIGYSLISVLIIYAIFHATFIRKQAKVSAGVMSFLAIYLAFIVGGMIRHDPEVTAAKKTLQEIEESFDDAMSSFVDGNGLPRSSNTAIDTTPTATGMLGEAERFMKTFLEEVRQVQNEYMTGIEEIRWMTILDEQRLMADPEFTESRIMINTAKKLVKQGCQRSLDLFDKGEEIMKGLDLSESMKQEMLESYRSSLGAATKQVQDNWDLEADTILQFDKAFDLLESTNGLWEFKNGGIVFEFDSDVQRFNEIMAKVQRNTAKQMQVQQDAVDRYKGQMKELKNSL